MDNKVLLALGSNIGNRQEYLKQALALLQEHTHIQLNNQSPIYETEPVGYVDQQPFLNMVVEIATSLEPLKLLEVTQSIELECGRKRDVRWGPRTLDLDILLYDEENMEVENLSIPHPRMLERAFVMIPLSDLQPDRLICNQQKTVGEIAQSLPDKEGVKRWIPNF
ncbi:2-amino-4-hydroxy-6-hydroxymethyldihydropteridine pyrophosphokinase [Alkalihalobacillus alcalophilus ATCC 27647 = CGMCC 1.3604]|uniref:2-amino-4-hydroxy-6-hydroxymethyldihydropteridine diphosphokinase n=1 Tax=Alkalihalobacillus alcalophilus ATCC 27647 = CGMCC 1.3604 TaxID=1218173 RepID=A0A094WHN8_ALKAL|nr:2-amino-4-hydroxy-6-hydroxymethyldihydropteridine diphosphokinase [Alkalihalobacillus alcalophilus]KGA96316.1 2-amino-4-hydroxy-6-hydroxymethyldihydropteridine pyrophosphokinase [Alkalihalobacillus alcalophilus ATCC 27647 = CGMCC 1.3604]MED1561714.1 2-amino-4-hydroxy-6-hydroxymethyldihydropteridine diphosphokinase [Alkalihalobacillus alcalophilus]THG92401.1 2-amino-4-hydroxy-6-hydroxymethyldihydropteridine pyrophosphokinase [Alkalihalobacillus alcalophilus ATCC 27647 = CGMCC 1.3604]